MDLRDATDIIASLPRGRTTFRYCRDKYALFLLGREAGIGRSVRDLRRSRFARLLDKPPVRAVCARAPRGVLSEALLENAWPTPPESYRLTLGIWDGRFDCGFNQVSRPGVNLALQLNFSAKHDRAYRDWIKAKPYCAFGSSSHPVAREGYLTLSWARIDLDPSFGEALIEEVQTDWLRDVQNLRRHIGYCDSPAAQEACVRAWLDREDVHLDYVNRYIERHVQPHAAIWDEATLTAALWFLRCELGVRRVFYHTLRGGTRLKGGSWGAPRSLYTALPRRFCFTETEDGPRFLVSGRRRGVRKRARKARYFVLEL